MVQPARNRKFPTQREWPDVPDHSSPCSVASVPRVTPPPSVRPKGHRRVRACAALVREPIDPRLPRSVLACDRVVQRRHHGAVGKGCCLKRACSVRRRLFARRRHPGTALEPSSRSARWPRPSVTSPQPAALLPASPRRNPWRCTVSSLRARRAFARFLRGCVRRARSSARNRRRASAGTSRAAPSSRSASNNSRPCAVAM